jgi:alpha-tubulin suppressor-like RCC1 family protein
MGRQLLLLALLGILSLTTQAQNLSFSGGNAHSIMLCASGRVYTMGRNVNGQLGINSTTQSLSPVQVLRGEQPGAGTYLDFIRQVDAGSGAHNITLTCDGNVYTWGWNSNGQIGDNTNTDRLVPTRVLNGLQTGSGTNATYLDAVTLVSGGNENSYAVLSTGELMSWGLNTDGQLGDGTTANKLTPVYVLRSAGVNLTNVIQIDGGDDFGVALLGDGTVWTWGVNANGQLGQNNNTSYSYATQVFKDAARTLPLNNIVKVTAGDTHVLALASDGTLWAWGGNWSGQLGVNTGGANAVLPAVVTVSAGGAALTGVVAISAGNQHSIVALSNGTVMTWGGTNNYQGQTGTGAGTSYPTLVPGLANIVDVSDGDLWTFAVSSTGTVYDWGQNGVISGAAAGQWQGSLGLGSSAATFPTPQTITLPCSFALQCVIANAGPDISLCNPPSATISASPNAANFFYRWKKDGVLIPGETTANLFVNTPGTYRVIIWDSTMINGCGICAPDSDDVVVTNASPITANNAYFCAPPCQAVNLSVTAAGTNYDWYSTLTGGAPLNGAPSSSFTTPCISTTTTYYVQDRSVTKCTAGYDYGAAALTGSASQWYTNTEHQFNFDVLSPFTLDSVTVRFTMINHSVCGGGVPSASGVFNILIKNSGGATLATINPVVPCGSGAVTVQIPIGYFFNTIGTNYRLEFGGGVGTPIFYYQGGAVFPKTDCSLIRFNNTSSGDTDDWGGFFSWKLRVGTNNCGRTPVQAILNCSLPLDFISFDAYRTNGTHKLIWTTNNEVNTHLFLIQRSSDGVSFETIGQVEALNIGGINHYTFIDPSPLAGINYYQLIQIDVNGDRSSSKMVQLSSSGENFDFSFYPNPSENDFHFNFNNVLQEEITLKVYNPEGKLISTFKTSGYDLSFGKELSAGIYFVTITSGQTQKTTKLFKN